MRSEKGITFIALILIVVLLIVLAGITIALVVTNENAETQTQTNVDFPVVVNDNANLDNSPETVVEENQTVTEPVENAEVVNTTEAAQ